MAEANIFGPGILIVIGILSICLAVFTGFNIYYYSQMKTDDTAGAVISSGTSSGMIVVNSLLCFVFTVITFWSIYRLIYSTDAGKKALGEGFAGLKQAVENLRKSPIFDKSGLIKLTKEEEKLALETAKNEKLKTDAEQQMIKEMNALAEEAAAIKGKIEKKNEDLQRRIKTLQISANSANEKIGNMPIRYERKEIKPEEVIKLETQLSDLKKDLDAKKEEIYKLTCQKGGNNSQLTGGVCPREPQNKSSKGIDPGQKIYYEGLIEKLNTNCPYIQNPNKKIVCEQLIGTFNKALEENNPHNANRAKDKFNSEFKTLFEGIEGNNSPKKIKGKSKSKNTNVALRS